MDHDNESNHVAISSIVHDACHGANLDGPCLVGAVAKLKAYGLWEDVAREASECADGGEAAAAETCRVARLLAEAEDTERTLGKQCRRLVKIGALDFVIPRAVPRNLDDSS